MDERIKEQLAAIERAAMEVECRACGRVDSSSDGWGDRDGYMYCPDCLGLAEVG